MNFRFTEKWSSFLFITFLPKWTLSVRVWTSTIIPRNKVLDQKTRRFTQRRFSLITSRFFKFMHILTRCPHFHRIFQPLSSPPPLPPWIRNLNISMYFRTLSSNSGQESMRWIWFFFALWKEKQRVNILAKILHFNWVCSKRLLLW